MEKSLKQLLLKDLCARLPYGVIVHEEWYYQNPGVKERTKKEEDHIMNCYDLASIETIRPYLRPLSSMTAEEKEELEKNYVLSSLNFVVYKIHRHKEWYGGDDEECTFDDYLWLIDWLNAHHFDYRGLIEKGLALEAPEGMYKQQMIWTR